MHLLGLAKTILFLSSWLGGALLIPIAIGFLFFQVYFPLYVVIVYYMLRAIWPAEKSDYIRESMGVATCPYYNHEEIILEDDVPPPEPNSKTMFAVGPHGVLTQGWCRFNTSTIFTKSDITYLIAEALFYFPFCRDFMVWGSGAPCTAPVFKKLMPTGANIALLPGGFEEATLYKRGVHRLYIKKRQGFIKYALQYGYAIRAGYVFGEEETYWTIKIWPKLMLWLNKFKIPGVVFVGKFFFLPNPDLNLYVVIGKPVQLPHIENPTKEDVDKYHALYIETMKALFNKYKGRCAKEGEAAELHIV